MLRDRWGVSWAFWRELCRDARVVREAETVSRVVVDCRETRGPFSVFRYSSSKITALFEKETERPPTNGSGGGGGSSSCGSSGREQRHSPPVTGKTASAQSKLPRARHEPPQRQSSGQSNETDAPLPDQHAQDDEDKGAADRSFIAPP